VIHLGFLSYALKLVHLGLKATNRPVKNMLVKNRVLFINGAQLNLQKLSCHVIA